MKVLNEFSVISPERFKTLWRSRCGLRARWRECFLSHLCFLLAIVLLLGQPAKADEEQACSASSEAQQASASGVDHQVCETMLEVPEGGVGADDNPLSFEAIDAHRAARKGDRIEANQLAAEEMMREGANQAIEKPGIQATATINTSNTSNTSQATSEDP